MFKENQVDGGDLLRKFLLEVRKFQTMSKDLVWKVLYLGKSPPFSHELSNSSEVKQKSPKRKGSYCEGQVLERKKRKH